MFNRQTALPWLNWGIATSFVLFQFFLQTTAGLMAHLWKVDFHLTSTEVGSLSASFFITYVIMQIPVGLAYDRLGARKVLIMASSLLSIGIFSLAYSQMYWQAFLARMLMGMGSGFGFVGMLYVTATWFSGRQFALLVGIAETLAMMGAALGEVVAAWAITYYGWRMTLIVAGLVALFVSLSVIIFIKDQADYLGQDSPPNQSLCSTLFAVLKNSQVWIGGLYGFAMVSIINVFATLWGVPFLEHRYHPVSLHTVGILLSMVFIGIGIGGPFIAWLVKYSGKRQLLMSTFSFATAMTLLFILYNPSLSLWSLCLMLFLLGFFSSSYIQVFAVVKDSVIDKQQATALSAANMILMSSSLLLQPLIGKALFLGFSYQHSLLLLVSVLLIATVLSFFLDKSNV